MNAEVLQTIVAETADRVVGRRIVRAVEHARDWLEFATDGPDRSWVGLSAVKALPLLYVADAPGEGGCDPADTFAAVVGSTVTSLAVVPGLPVVLMSATHTDTAGRTTERTVRLHLGERPSLSVEDGPPERADGSPGARGPAANDRPAVAWRRDDSGRLHVGIPPNEGPWDGTAEFDAWNEAALHAARELLPEIVVSARRANLARVIGLALARKRRALSKVQAEMDDSERADEYRHKAQLLLTRRDSLKRGERMQRVLDYDNVTEVEIEVDPSLPAARNAEALFARARKADRRAKRTPERAAELEAEIEGLERDLESIDAASPQVLSGLEERFRPPRRRQRRRGGKQRARFRTYTVTGGWKVLVGKSNRDNDILTHRIARPSDLWFHVRQSPGSHVILQRAGRKDEPGQEAIVEAAAIAAFHSKSSGGTTVPVAYTERRYVRKPRGAKPGLAVVTNEKVVFVEPGLPD